MKVLLSIKPQFAELIFSGRKKYEFRKTIFTRRDVDKVIVYASYPICKVVGEFEIDGIIVDNPYSLWKKTKTYAGISREFFFSYFSNKKFGYAICIKNYYIYKAPLCIQSFFSVKPPQSFAYVQ